MQRVISDTARYLAILLGVLLVALCAAVYYYKTFSHFNFYDDEGYIMLSVAHVLRGGALFNEVYSQYGPSFYFFRWILHNIFSVPLSHDAARIGSCITIVFSLSAAAVVIYRATGLVWMSLLSIYPTFSSLGAFYSEPGHPQEMISAILLCVVVVASYIDAIPGRLLPSLTAFGVLCILFAKINIGIFVGASLVLAVLAAGGLTLLPWIVRISLVALVGALPVAVLHAEIAEHWVRYLLVLTTLSLLPVSVVVLQSSITSNQRKDLLFGVLVGSFCGCITMILVAWMFGSPPQALLEGMLLQHLANGPRFLYPLDSAAIQHIPLIVGLTLFAVVTFLRMPDRHPRLLVFLKGAYALLLWMLLYRMAWQELLSWGVPGAWLLLCMPNGSGSQQHNLFFRAFIASTAVLLPLQIFPVAGTQLPLAMVVYVFVAAQLLFDAVGPVSRLFRATSMTAAFVLSLWLLVPQYFTLSGNYYQHFRPLLLPGAKRLRMPAVQVAMVHQLVAALQNRPGTFFTYPGLGSLYFWTGKPAPTMRFATAWMFLLPPEIQREVIREFEQSNQLQTVVYNPEIAEFWSGFAGQREATPLTAWLIEHSEPEQSIALYQIRRLSAAQGSLDDPALKR